MRKSLLLLFSCLFVTGLVYVSFLKVKQQVKKDGSYLLSSPYQLNIFSLSFTPSEDLVYLSTKNIRTREGEKMISNKTASYEIIIAFSPVLVVILTTCISSIFILFLARLDLSVRLFLILSVFTLFYYISFMDYITFKYWWYSFYLLGILIVIPFIYFFRDLLNKKNALIPWLFFGVVSVIVMIELLPSNANQELLLLRYIGLFRLAVFIYCVFLLLVYLVKLFSNYSKDIQKQNLSSGQSIARFVFAFLFLITFHIDFIMFSWFSFYSVKTNVNYNAIFFLPAFSIGIYSILGPRFGLIPFKVIIRESLVRFFFLIAFTVFCVFFIGFQLISIFNNEKDLLFSIIFVLLFLIIIDPFRTIVFFFLDRSYLKRNSVIQEYHSQISQYFNDPHSLPVFLNKIIRTIKDGMEIEKVIVCFDLDTFKNINLERYSIIYDQSIWQQVNKRRKFIKIPVFTEWSGGKISKLLKKENSFALIAFEKNNAAIIVSKKKNQNAFLSSDIKFLKILAKYGSSFLENYQFFIETTKIKRHENELALGSNIQKNILPNEYQDEDITLRLIIQPFQKVTGDYIGFFKKHSREYLIFLGDVSGHGLGSAYLMAVIQSMIQASIRIYNEKLDSIFSKIDRYLVNEYKGHDFITLTGMQISINRSKKQADIKFINAGQHPALIYLKSSKRLEKLKSHQRVIGVVDTQYTTTTYKAKESFRIFIYSDGIFEILDQEGHIIGEKQVQSWILESSEMSIDEQKNYILNKLEDTQCLYIMDDISFAITEINL